MNEKAEEERQAHERDRKRLEEKIDRLEKELELEKLRSLAYDTMIDVAEEKYGIEIRKKSGAKQ